MIKLEKSDEPTVLRDNKEVWTKEFLTAKANGVLTDTIRYRYRHPDIKKQICDETKDKCAYCESKITHVYPGDIEHILPRSERPELICEWENLTLGCGECNRKKGTYYSLEDPLINPYADNPEDHLFGYGTLIFAIPGDKKGALTELKLELNRPKLIERRLERIGSLRNLADKYVSQTEGEYKNLLRNELKKEISRDKEYTFIARGFLYSYCNITPNEN